MPLHLTKIAFGCDSATMLRERLEARRKDKGGLGEVQLTTRYMPKRHKELVGGSLYWIHASALVGRSPILGFQENGEGKYWIRLEPTLIPVRNIPCRPHQGWRYLEDKDAPPDLGGAEADARDEMPTAMLGDLMKMGLV